MMAAAYFLMVHQVKTVSIYTEKINVARCTNWSI